jgi:hypothetical protein
MRGGAGQADPALGLDSNTTMLPTLGSIEQVFQRLGELML